MITVHQARTCAGASKTVVQVIFACWLLLTLTGGLASNAYARDAYVPFKESLEATQRRAYIDAAARGQNEVLQDQEDIVFAPAQPVLEEESRLEQIAAQQKGALSLDETQQAQVLASELEQFGYDVFNRVPTSFAPVDGIPVPEGYRIGPGDNIIVQLFGKRNVEYKLVVTRDGNILVPE